MLSESHFPST